MKKLTKNDCGEMLELKDLQMHLLQILLALHEFCEKNGIRYYLSGGTLLGAIRHKGFIPWDDDADVNMPRPDCDKLQKLAGGKIGKYTLICPNADSEFPQNFYRIYDESIVIENTHGGKTTKCDYMPAFIDIFPIDGMPDNDKDTLKIFKRIKFNKKMIYYLKGWFHGSTILAKFFHLFTYPIASLFGAKYWRGNIQKIARNIPFEESEYVGVLMTNIHWLEERVKKSEYIPQIDVEFEGYKFKAPAGYHTYLTQLYGDYMQLPPEEKRVSHHGFKLYKRKQEDNKI